MVYMPKEYFIRQKFILHNAKRSTTTYHTSEVFFDPTKEKEIIRRRQLKMPLFNFH